MDSIAAKAKEKVLEEIKEKIKEGAPKSSCFLSCLGPKPFMKIIGSCVLTKDVAETVNELISKLD